MTLLCPEMYEIWSCMCALLAYSEKGKVVPAHATTACRRTGIIALFIPEIDLVVG
jgi:hypothetical protein